MVKIAIKNPAPLGQNLEKWGDYHFALSLAQCFEKRGAQVVQHFWPEWDRDDGEDVILVLRGKRNYIPPKNKTSIMWVISHPATVFADEMRAYHRVYVASENHYRMIRNDPSINVDVARQCTDTSIFRPGGGATERRGISFVANSRGVRRDILAWALEAGTNVSVVGRHWKSVGLQRHVVKDYITNTELPAFYGSTRLTLNDHWGDMYYYGYVNNRIFDCLACGTPILTDYFPELKSICGDRLLYARDKDSFAESIKRYYLAYPDVLDNAASLWRDIGPNYSFDARAEQILDWIKSQRWTKHPTSPTQGANESSPQFSKMLEKAISLVRERGISREIQMLHLFPDKENVDTLFRNSELSYLSAGFGKGPWHIFLDDTMSALADRNLDFILVDDSQLANGLNASALLSILESARKKIAPKGVIVVPAGLNAVIESKKKLSDGYFII